MKFINENLETIDHENTEITEQYLAETFIEENDVVFELGARYGTVSCIINKKLKNKKNQVVVEPDSTVWDALEHNKMNNDCEFYIVKGFVSNTKMSLTEDGYSSTCFQDAGSKIKSFTIDDIKRTTGINAPFNVLVADCEGFLETFFDENPTFYDCLRLILFEADLPEKCNYTKIVNRLADLGFVNIMRGHQNAWLRPCEDNRTILNRLFSGDLVLKSS